MYKMKLLEQPFNDIFDGSKKIEYRLYDEKRRKLKIGDKIEFSKLPYLDEKLYVKVVDLYKYRTFKELFETLEYSGICLEKMVNDMHSIYTPEQEAINGVLGIKIEKINE